MLEVQTNENGLGRDRNRIPPKVAVMMIKGLVGLLERLTLPMNRDAAHAVEAYLFDEGVKHIVEGGGDQAAKGRFGRLAIALLGYVGDDNGPNGIN